MVKFVISSPAMKPRKVLLELLCRFYQSPSSYTREHDDGPPPRLAAGPMATGVGRQLIQWCLDYGGLRFSVALQTRLKNI